MKKLTRVFALILLALTVFMCISVPASALSWDGSSEGGGGHGTDAGPNGYAIRYVTNKNLLGYRFSCVDRYGNNKVSKVIDVFRSTSDAPYADYACDYDYKFTTKYNKKQLINNQNCNYSTSVNSTWCYKQDEMGFASSLPEPDGLETWQNNTTNLNKVLSKLGIGSIENLNYGDKILIEQIYDIRLESVYHALTVTETAIYGKHILGAYSDGGSSSTSESWGFISSYVNKHYPNALFTPDGQGLWTGASATSSRLMFYTIINSGYGVGIAYTEEHEDFSPVLSVKECRAYKGTKPTKNFHYGTSTGNAWGNWTYVQDYPCSGDKIFFSVNFPKETQNIAVWQYVWIDGTLVDSRYGYSDNLEWFDVAASVTTVPNNKSYYTVKARVDWIEDNGTVKKYGAEKTFYIPVKPITTRDKVTAYNELGNAQAYTTGSSTTGKLYFGQKVTFQYQYGATTAWESNNNVRAIAYYFNNSNWSYIYTGNSSGEDVSVDNVVLSSTKTYTKNSSIGSYVIPLTANNYANSYKLRFDLKTAWSKDPSHTTQSSTFYLPIVKSDVAITDMKLVDSTGHYADLENLTVGETYTIRYVYKNNTDTTVFVKGYGPDKNLLPGVYAIEPNGTIEIDGGTHIAPDVRDYTIWGGVYLSTVERGNTDYETDGTNNEKLFNCHTNPLLGITPITPNALYRESTQVISTFRVWNYSERNVLPSDNVTVKIRVYKPGATSPFYITTKTVVIPAIGSNIVYCKWTVPSGLGGKSVRVVAELYEKGKFVESATITQATTPYTIYTTPDTQYEENAPRGFTIPSATSVTYSGALWKEYEYDSVGGLRLKTYEVKITKTSPQTITPATGETAYKKNGYWYMKSGYGIAVESRINLNLVHRALGSLSSSTTATSSMYTLPQYAYVLYPEYRYVFGEGTSSTLIKRTGEAYSYFELRPYLDYGNVHFTPLWYPNGNYTVKIIQTDCWTPAGMIQQMIVPTTIKIDGNAYDDFYAGRR